MKIGVLSALFIIAVTLKWIDYGTPATWSWWFLLLAFLVPLIVVMFLQSVSEAMKELSQAKGDEEK